MHSKEAAGCRLCRYRRVQEKRPDRDCLNGEVTVYLTLTFVLFVSLILALVESASVQMAKNYRRADMNRALECVFAEYQKELLENYDVFAIECGYETGTYTEQNILDRLSYYGADMENEIERIQLFTDNSGELFRDQVGKYMKHKYGIAWADKYLGNVSLWKNQEEKADEFTEEEEKQNDQLKDLLGEQEAELPEEENPMQHVAELKRSPILELVLPKDKTISEKQISLQEMPEKRENHTGYGAFSDVEPEDGTLTSVLLGEYVNEAIQFLRLEQMALDAVAVSCGPGSYTGLRIGVSEAKGLCYGLNIPLIAINTLENKADDLYHIGISSLFENEKDPFELIKKKEILETLEKSVDKAEDISDAIKTIMVKLA